MSLFKDCTKYITVYKNDGIKYSRNYFAFSQGEISAETTPQVLRRCILAFISGGTQREYSSKPLKHSIDERILVFKR